MGFDIANKKGFHIEFDNGWTVSVQFGPGNYCDNYNARIGEDEELCGKNGSNTAEIAAYNNAGVWHDFGDDTVKGYVSANEVLEFMNEVAKK